MVTPLETYAEIAHKAAEAMNSGDIEAANNLEQEFKTLQQKEAGFDRRFEFRTGDALTAEQEFGAAYSNRRK